MDELFTDPLQHLLNNLPVRKPLKRKVKRTYRYDLKQLYSDARKNMFAREYPTAWKDGKYHDVKIPDVETTNGASRYIEDVVNNLGHHCERINTMGIPTKNGWRRSGSTIGSADLHCIIAGKTWKIEIKKGSDTLNKAQEKYQAKMKAIGAYHSVIYVGDMDMFWDEFYKIIAI